MAGVVLSLLGPPSVSSADGRPLAALGAKSLALLAYLACTGRSHTREELAGLLWGESPESEARASLRQVLKQLRDGLGDAVVVGRAQVRLAASVDSDVGQFREALRTDPRRAATFDVPRFLSGFLVRHAPRFEEWLAETRRQLVDEYEGALATLGREAMGGWRWREAVGLADRWQAADPLSEEAAHLGVEALYLSGDRGAARARFEEYRVLLRRETACEPGRALLSLVRRIEADADPAAARPVSDEWYVRAPALESSLVGRAAEWAMLERVWKAVRRGSGRLVLIEGESGVGKSRLVEEFLRRAVADGGTILRGRGVDARTGLPYAPVVEILRDTLTAPGLAGADPDSLTEVARLVPELRHRFEGLPEPAAPADATDGWRLFEGIAQLLLALAAESPVVVWLDDLQWCDADTCQLLRYLGRRLEHTPVLWLFTVTLGELERDAPAARLCRALRAKSDVGGLSLSPLTEAEVWEMIREMGHLSTPTGGRRLAGRLHGITSGNPFYLVELLKTMFAQGLLSLDPVTGAWTSAPSAAERARGELPMSRTVHDVIAARVERLPDLLRDILITIAVAGSGCSAAMLSHVHGISRLRAASLADALVDRRLVVEADRVYGCAHRVIARVVREGLTVSRRREVHRMLALALERASAVSELRSMAADLARHAHRGGEPELAYRFALLAGEEAVRRLAFEEALSWLDLAAGVAASPAEAEAVNRRTADVLGLAGWSEAPPLATAGRLQTREIEREDLDLTVPG